MRGLPSLSGISQAQGDARWLQLPNFTFANLGSKPTTIAGYGITDGAVMTSGTWTPTLAFGGASVGITYSQQDGWYRKWGLPGGGSVVQASWAIILTNKGSSTGNASVKGLPFTTDTVPIYGASIIWGSFLSITTPVWILTVLPSVTEIFMVQGTSVANLTNANWTNGASVRGSIVYGTAS